MWGKRTALKPLKGVRLQSKHLTQVGAKYIQAVPEIQVQRLTTSSSRENIAI